VSEAQLLSFARELRRARSSHAPPLPLQPPTCSSDDTTCSRQSKAKDEAQLVHMRIVNLMWDGDILPLPFIANGPQLIPRARLERALQEIKPLVVSHLARRPKGLPTLGCLEWGVQYSSTIFRNICEQEVNAIKYRRDQQHVDAGNSSIFRTAHTAPVRAVYHMDICTTSTSDAEVWQQIPRDGGFKFVIATQVFEHLEHPFRCAANLFKIVGAGGVVVFTAPFAYPWHGVPKDFFRYTSEGLAQVAEAAGFTILRHFGVGNRRELDAQNAGFPVSAVPPHVFEAKSDAFYHTAVVVVQIVHEAGRGRTKNRQRKSAPSWKVMVETCPGPAVKKQSAARHPIVIETCDQASKH